MKPTDGRFDLDLRDGPVIRKLGLREKLTKGGYVYETDPKAQPGWPFPYCIEEAAYLLLGLAWKGYSDDFRPLRNEAGDKLFQGDARLAVFNARGGLDLYQRLHIDLGTDALPDLSIFSLWRWASDSENSKLLKHAPKDFWDELEGLVAGLQQKKPFRIKDIKLRRALVKSIEKNTGYKFGELSYDSANDRFIPKDESKGKKGTEMARTKTRVRVLARSFIKEHPQARPYEFFRSSEMQRLNDSLTPAQRPISATLKSWVKDLPFNRKKGRPAD